MEFPSALSQLLGVFPLLLAITIAQRPPSPENVTVIASAKFPNASISYKETQICETTQGVKGYSGFVNLPPNTAEGRAYELHTWFWFFEARNFPEHAPLSLWFNGGPGSPSSPAAVGENGPCLVLPNSRDTKLNPWSWNDRVNMLYIDQPVQVGFSHDTLVDNTVNEVASPFSPSKLSASDVNSTVLAGVLSSQNTTLSPDSTVPAATAIWEFLQVWMQESPFQKPKDGKFSIWAESYGGHYAPTFADFFQTQNDRITSRELSSETFASLQVDTVGLINACVDINTQMPYYPVMANNNTYGIKLFNESAYAGAVKAVPQCLNLTTTCRGMVDKLDPEGWGNNTEVNQACLQAYAYCFQSVALEDISGYLEAKVDHFDITTPEISSFPPKWAAGYYNTAEVQQALGVPLNWTGLSTAISTDFTMAGDFVKGNNLDILGQLLDRGVKVALVYGDRDYQCNWFGGEALSLAIQSQSTAKFQDAGYADIRTNASYVGGAVRQYGNLSFSRVYQAGHEVPYYQPETAFQIFNRVMFGQDVATGEVTVDPTYQTTGANTSLTGDVDVPIEFSTYSDCYLWDILETCDRFQAALFNNGSAITRDFVLVGYRLADGTEVMYTPYLGNGTNGSTTTGPVSASSSAPVSGASGVEAGSASFGCVLWFVILSVLLF